MSCREGRIAIKMLLLCAVSGALAAGCAGACAAPPAPVRVAPGVYALPGTGGEITPENRGRIANVVFIVGPRGVAVIDTGISAREGEAIIAAVRRVSDQPIRLAILTHPSQEAIFGAAAFQAHGVAVLAHRDAAVLIGARCDACLGRLRTLLGDAAMAGTRVVTPDRLVDGDETIDVIGRPLRLIAPRWTSAPGAIAVYDPWTSTLVSGTLASIGRVPDLRDANVPAWRAALPQLASLRCRHLVAAYGPAGRCADIPAFARYFAALDDRVAALLKDGVSLAEVRAQSGLPAFAQWDQYDTLNPQNANLTYLRLERAQFE